jgi:hypothetical protein
VFSPAAADVNRSISDVNISSVIPSPLIITAIGIGVGVGGEEVGVLVGLEIASGEFTTGDAVCSIPHAEISKNTVNNMRDFFQEFIPGKLY